MEVPRRDLVAGIIALAIPALATIWPGVVVSEPTWWPSFVGHGIAKLAVTVLWLGAAGLIVFDGLRRDRAVADLTREAKSKRESARNTALKQSLDGMLNAQHAFGRKWDFTVYLYDEDENVLTPSYPTPGDDNELEMRTFKPGNGATGQAWQDEATICRQGEEVSNAKHGLTEAQQEFYKSRGTVAATPIYTDLDVKIGVLSVICDGPDGTFLRPDGQAQLRETATSIGTLIAALDTTP